MVVAELAICCVSVRCDEALVAGVAMTCALAGNPICECSPRYTIQWHHVYPKGLLKAAFRWGAWVFGGGVPGRAASRLDMDNEALRSTDAILVPLDVILADPRNRLWICEAHHERVSNARVYTDIPGSVWEFCRDFGLVGSMENRLAKQAA